MSDPEVYTYNIKGYQFARADMDIMIYSGYRKEEVEVLFRLADPRAEATPGFIVDEYGIRTRTTSLWPDARALDGTKSGFPIPGNFHWETIEWIGLMRSVLEADGRYRIMELGAGWGPAIVSGSVLARLRGLTDIRMTGVEGDPHHYAFMIQHLTDNGFSARDHVLHRAAVAAKKGVANWPKTTDSSDNYGFRPIKTGGDYMGRHFPETQKVSLIAMRDLVRAEPLWDLIHIDIQGAEFEVCASAIKELNTRAKRVMIGTHSRKLDGDLVDLFTRQGWNLENEKPCKFNFWPNPKSLEAMTTVDGTQTWRNPRIN